MAGPLAGLRVVELGGLVAGPFCGMMLADMGAEVVRIDRPGSNSAASVGPPPAITGRGRRVLELDLKTPTDVGLLLDLIGKADVFFESFRPGVAERLGLGPDVCLGRNPRLVYGRLTGWGQDGYLAPNAGHDINYIAHSGFLAESDFHPGTVQTPFNVLGDLGGGGLLLAFGVLAALRHADRTGEGQVVDAAMIDGAALLMATVREYASIGVPLGQGVMPSAGNHPLYTVYECAGGGRVAIGCMEMQFRHEFARVLGIDPEVLAGADDPSNWVTVRAILAPLLLQRTRDEWTAIMEPNRQMCFAPVLGLEEAPKHRHAVERQIYMDLDGVIQPAPAPRFSRTVPDRPVPTCGLGDVGASDILQSWLGFTSVVAAKRLEPDGGDRSA